LGYLKWKHIIPLKDKRDNENIIAAKIIVFDTKNRKKIDKFYIGK
jgi:hypothetical protein